MIHPIVNFHPSAPATLTAAFPPARRQHGNLELARILRLDASAASETAILCAIPAEPEDARLTGATRSLYRRLLALNLPGNSPRSSAFDRPKVA